MFAECRQHSFSYPEDDWSLCRGVKRRAVGKSGATVHLHAPLLLCGVVLNGAHGFACTKLVLQSVLTGSLLGTAAPAFTVRHFP